MSKLVISEERKLVQLMADNLISRLAALGYTTEHDCAKKIGMSRGTFHNRLNEPASWRLIEFTRAAVATHTNLVWLCEEHDIKKGYDEDERL